jgi:hypothetical protein
MKSIKQYSLGGYSVVITDGRGYFNYAVEIGSDFKINVPSFMTIGSGSQVVLRVLPRQSKRL